MTTNAPAGLGMDPIQFEVIRNAFEAAAAKMKEAEALLTLAE